MLNFQGHFKVTQGHFQITIYIFIIVLLIQVRFFPLCFCTPWHIKNNIYIIIKYSKIAFLHVVRGLTKM